METVKFKLTIDPNTGIFSILNTSDQVFEISVQGSDNQDPEKPMRLLPGCTLYSYEKHKEKKKRKVD